jgi:hypothetical protein
VVTEEGIGSRALEALATQAIASANSATLAWHLAQPIIKNKPA